MGAQAIVISIGLGLVLLLWVSGSRLVEARTAARPAPELQASTSSKPEDGKDRSGRTRLLCRDKRSETPLAGIEVFAFRDDQLPAPHRGSACPPRSVLVGRVPALRSDERGFVELPRPDRPTRILAFGSSQIGLADLDRWTAEATVELRQARQVEVSVIDERNRPVPSAQVVWTNTWQGRTSDANRLIVDELGQGSVVVEAERGGQAMRLGFAVAGMDEDATRVDAMADDLPDLVTLRVGGFGRLELQVSGLEERGVSERDCRVVLRLVEVEGADVRSKSAVPLLATIVGGRAHFGCLPLGVPFELELDFGPSSGLLPLSTRAPEMTADGRIRRIALDASHVRPAPLLRGRLVDAEGRGLPGMDFQLRSRLVGDAMSPIIWQEGRSDSLGVFEIPIVQPHSAWDEGSTWRLEFSTRNKDGSTSYHHMLSEKPITTTQELGDIALAPEPLLVAGRIIDGQGAPRGGVSIQVEKEVYQLDRELLGHAWKSWNSLSDEDGYFEIRGRTRVPGIQVSMEDEFGGVTRYIGQVGVEGRGFVLPRSGRLQLHLRRADGRLLHGLRFVVQPQIDDGLRSFTVRRSLPATGELNLSLAPGDYQVQVFSRWPLDLGPLWTSEVRLEEGKVSVQEGVLEGDYRFEVDVSWCGILPDQGNFLYTVDGEFDSELETRFIGSYRNGRARMVLAETPCFVRIFGDGYPASVILVNNPDSAELIRTEVKREIEITLEGLEGLPEHVDVSLILGPRSDDWFGNGAMRVLTAAENRGTYFVDGPGLQPYRIQFSEKESASHASTYKLSLNRSGQIEVADVDSDEPQAFVIRIPDETRTRVIEYFKAGN